MAAITNATDTASLPEFINSEYISRRRLDAARVLPSFVLVADERDLTGRETNTISMGQWDEIDVPAGTHTETDEIAATEHTASEVSVSMDAVAMRAAVSTRVIDRVDGLMGDIMEQQIKAMRKRQDSDYWTNTTSATNTGDHSGLPMDLDIFDDEYNAFLNQYPPGMGRLYFQGHPDTINDLQKAFRAAGASIFGENAAASEAMALLRAGRNPVQGVWRDVLIMRVEQTVQFDASNWSNTFGVANDSSIAHVFENKTNVMTGSRERLAHVVDPIGRRDSIDVVITSSYGDGIVSNDNVREVVTMKAA